MKKKGNVLISVLVLCILLGVFSSLVCRYSTRILAGNGKIPKIQEEILKRERLESEVRGRGMYVFQSDEGIENKIELFELLMEDFGFDLVQTENFEGRNIMIGFHDTGICELAVEIELGIDEKIEKFRVNIINF